MGWDPDRRGTTLKRGGGKGGGRAGTLNTSDPIDNPNEIFLIISIFVNKSIKQP